MQPELCQLRSLQDLNLSGNRLKTAIFPAEWTYLRTLTLAWNLMVILPPIECLQELVSLQLNDNKLTEVPPGLAALTKLQVSR